MKNPTTKIDKWNRKLGTSKREQGIATPKDLTRRVSKAKRKARKEGGLKEYFKRLPKIY